MFCNRCGSQQTNGARFCSQCGQQMEPGAAVGAVAHDPPTTRRVEQVMPRLRTNLPDFVEQAIHPSELILASYSASLFDHRRSGQFRHDKFVLTDERIIYFHTGLVHKGMGEMPYRVITGVAYNKGWVHGKVVVEAANAGLTISGIGNDDAAFAEKLISSALRGCKFELAASIHALARPVVPAEMQPATLLDESNRVQLPRKVLVRLEPSSTAAVSGSIPRGTGVTVVKTQGNWAWIQADDGREGWIDAASLKR